MTGRQLLALRADVDCRNRLLAVAFPLGGGLGHRVRQAAGISAMVSARDPASGLGPRAAGQAAEGMAQIRQALVAWQSMGAEMSQPWYMGLLAEAYGHHGQIADGLQVLREALAVTARNEEASYEAELHRLQGTCVLRQTIPDEHQAETCLHQALTLARQPQAKSWELRAAMSLARLWQPQGKRAEAYDLLTPSYDWFTEGFDTADLQEAKALLEELA